MKKSPGNRSARRGIYTTLHAWFVSDKQQVAGSSPSAPAPDQDFCALVNGSSEILVAVWWRLASTRSTQVDSGERGFWGLVHSQPSYPSWKTTWQLCG